MENDLLSKQLVPCKYLVAGQSHVPALQMAPVTTHSATDEQAWPLNFSTEKNMTSNI